MSTIYVVVGGQFGSEGKGAVGAYLARKHRDIEAAVRVAGPNAGHSAYDDRGNKWALRQIPVAAVRPDLQLVLAQGSEIDLGVLESEIHLLGQAGLDVSERLMIDRWATIITDEHKEAEGHFGGHLTQRVGSTGKGVGAARAERIWRRAPVYGTSRMLNNRRIPGTDTARYLAGVLFSGQSIMLEGTQGYGLGLHAGYYPQCTSSNCRAIDFLAMAGICPWDADRVESWVVLRTYPIRVAGNSGPLKDETTWEALQEQTDGYIQPEKTTVTQKVRRVGNWDADLARAAVQAHGSSARVALTFFDYWYPELAGETTDRALTDQHWEHIGTIEAEIGCRIGLLGTGPNSIIDLREGL